MTELAEVKAREPKLDEAGWICVHAWFRLDSERHIGMVAGPIPGSAVRAWCRDKRMSRPVTEIVEFVIQQLDADRAMRERDRIARAQHPKPTASTKPPPARPAAKPKRR